LGNTANDAENDPFVQGQQGTGLNANLSNGISYNSGRNMRATIAYDGTNLYEQIIDLDTATRTMFQYNYGAVDLATRLGGDTAWIGFTAATGGTTEILDIKNWVYSQSPIVVGPTIPTPVSNKIDDGTTQRSMLRSLTVTFDTPVTNMAAGAMKLLKYSPDATGLVAPGDLGTDISATLNTPTSTDGGITWVWTFKADANTTSGSLNDGVYSYVLDKTKVSGPGGAMTADYTGPGKFHRIFGDVNNSKNVNNADFTVFRGTFLAVSPAPAYNAAFDYDANGTVNNADFGQFRARFLSKSFSYT